MASTLAIREETGVSAIAAELKAHRETHGGVGSDRVKSIVFGGLDGVITSE
jgi:hypothetical protein